ncbi:MAG: helicase-associated domain-containing protein, partial [Micromonosporaceae bacterium]
VLDRLAAGPPIGTLRDARRTDQDEQADGDSAKGHAPDSALSPVRWLISRHLLVPTDTDTVELPREVALVLRRDAGPLGELNPEPPAIEPALQDPAKVDAAGAGQAMEAVRQVDTLLEALAAEPPPMLRAGGIGIREIRRLAKATGIEEPLAALLLETAGYAGLLADDREAEPHWLPTTAYDTWRDGDLAERWTRLVTAWLAMTRQPGLVGRRERTSTDQTKEPAPGERRSARDRLPNVLGPDVERMAAPALRRSVLECLGGLADGAAPQAADVVRLLAWQTPRRGGRHREETTGWALDQAAALGLTGLGALTSYGRPLIDGDATEATAVLAKLLPEPVDHVLVQADLTVVVPGPPEASLAVDLALVAEPESGGGATVYRVTAGSVRRALDAGMTADDLHELFIRRSVTSVPQGLTYLIDDAARRHGGVRVGSAGAYLRSDDAARLAEVSADRRLSHLGLRRIAPTVLVTPYAPARLLTALRECGYAPVPEDATGAVVLTRPDVPRAPSRPSVPRPVADLAELDHPRALAVVEAIRRGDETARRARRSTVTQPSPVVSVTETLGVLQQALRTRRNVWVGYVDTHGGDASRLVRPVSMGGGYLRAEDGRTEMVHTFALHRITSAALDE